MNTALAGTVSTTIRPTRALRDWLARAAVAVGLGAGRRGHTLDRDELARRHELRQEARRLRDEQIRNGAYARLL
ncbi:hypothetical protein MUN74_06860 [Agromyces endophyticus]|uniref:hypothetical protein n=1 Tax=Agromyces sp. H17E-10 TaxID=2932244 RepID=UPI001FD5DA43|nr:hypothetical protein [Agromyces sp. H17E-10]UOQ90626.1 hypothetical protein MUN74_06860 [Agromyces sp. H17E-10]